MGFGQKMHGRPQVPPEAVRRPIPSALMAAAPLAGPVLRPQAASEPAHAETGFPHVASAAGEVMIASLIHHSGRNYP